MSNLGKQTQGIMPKKVLTKTVFALLYATTLVACGGGGSSSGTGQDANKDQGSIETSAESVKVENGVKTTMQTTSVGTVTTEENVASENSDTNASTSNTTSTSSEATTGNTVQDSNDTKVSSTTNSDGSVTVKGLEQVNQKIVAKTALGNCGSFQDQVEILKGINAIRAKARKCGKTSYAAAKPLTWNNKLTEAALNHAEYMAATGEFDHKQKTKDMETVSKRITATGYEWLGAGENISRGDVAYKDVLENWVESELHCANLMEPRYEHFGAACMTTDDKDIPAMWTQVFAKPKS